MTEWLQMHQIDRTGVAECPFRLFHSCAALCWLFLKWPIERIGEIEKIMMKLIEQGWLSAYSDCFTLVQHCFDCFWNYQNRVYWRNWKDDEIFATAQADWTGSTEIAHSDCFTLVLTPHANSLIALTLFTHLMAILTNWWFLIRKISKNPRLQN